MKRLALVGMPNTGKSTLFNRISGAYAKTGNWPGVTVDLMRARLLLGSDMVEIVDLPGIYDLQGYADDENIVRQFLSSTSLDAVIVIANITQLDRQLRLLLQLNARGLRTVLVLNMADEGRKLGITVDQQGLASAIGCPVVTLSAKHGEGVATLMNTLQILLQSPPATPAKVECDDENIHSTAMLLFQRYITVPARLSGSYTDRIDHILLHPVLGIPLFFAVMYGVFQLIFSFGRPLQDGLMWCFSTLNTLVLSPFLSVLPFWLSSLLLDGVYNGVTTVITFLPLIVLFFLIMSVVEDSGYLARTAFLMDALMAKLGLDGRGFVMILMGFGCNVPALLGTRIMRSQAMRRLTMLVIPFSLCSARLQVFLFLISILFSPQHAPLVLFSLYVCSFVVIFMTAFLFRGHYISNEPFMLELPPYRLPTLRQTIARTGQEMRHFLTRASKFIVLGAVLVWALTHLPSNVPSASPATLAGQLSLFLMPILSPIGINPALGLTLLFGFVAKEVVIGALAVIYSAQGDLLVMAIKHDIDSVQALSFMLFTLIYTPCLSTVATLKSETKSSRFVWMTTLWSLILAWLVSFVFYQGARAMGF